ncbi:MAG: DUF4091 domain-containing protein [Clostridia bacterium]|nr:DUF4091 domain-containing protein [Clostridia bacterium]
MKEANVKICLADALTKVFFHSLPEEILCKDLRLSAAAGEKTSFQLACFAEEAVDGLRLSLPEGCELFREIYVDSKKGKLPDALLPVPRGAELSLEEGTNAFWITFASRKVGAGCLSLSLSLGGACLFSAEIPTHIYDAPFPEAYRCGTNTGIGRADLCGALGLKWEDYAAGKEETVTAVEEAYRKTYAFLVSYGFSPSSLPYPLGDPRAESYLDDPRVTSFVLPWNAEEETLRAWRAILAEHPAWAKKAMFYPVDEPMTVAALETLAERAKALRAAFPEATVVTPLHRDLQLDEETDSFRFLEGITDLWCPKAALFSDYVYSEEQKAKFPPIGERMRARKKAGDRLWWYVCCEPAAPYANVHMDLDLIEARVLFWQQAREEVDGFLYWSSTYWRNTEDVFVSAPHYQMGVTPVYGDGVLCYFRDGEPIPSVRLMALEEGMRDFARLCALKQKDPALAEELLQKIAGRVDDFPRDKAAFLRARERLFEALDA